MVFGRNKECIISIANVRTSSGTKIMVAVLTFPRIFSVTTTSIVIYIIVSGMSIFTIIDVSIFGLFVRRKLLNRKSLGLLF